MEHYLAGAGGCKCHQSKKTKTRNAKQAPDMRTKNFEEVALGYTEDLAVAEATRCIGCPKKPCVAGCPVGVDIPEFISLIAEATFWGQQERSSEEQSTCYVWPRVSSGKPV